MQLTCTAVLAQTKNVRSESKGPDVRREISMQLWSGYEAAFAEHGMTRAVSPGQMAVSRAMNFDRMFSRSR
jgi:hypothetical protein